MTTKDLTQLLTEAVEGVPEIDFAERAWQGAHARQAATRRRSVASVAAAAAVVVGAIVWLNGSPAGVPAGNPTNAQTAVSSQKTTTNRLGWQRTPSGVRYTMMPVQGTEKGLSFTNVGLPEVIDTTRPRLTWSTSTEQQRRTVVAAYLEAAKGNLQSEPYPNEWRPVLVLRDGSQMTVDGLILKDTVDQGGNGATPLDDRAFDPSGMRMAFAQPGKLVVLDLGARTIRSYPVPSQLIEQVGWLGDPGSSTVIVSGDDGVWRLDLSAAKPQAVRVSDSRDNASAGAKRFRTIDPEGAGRGVVDTFTSGNRVSTTQTVWPLGEPWGEAMTSGTSTLSAFFVSESPDGPLPGLGGLYQGIVVTSDPARPSDTTLWALTDGDGTASQARSKGAATALGWDETGKTAIVAVGASDGLSILGLDPESGTVSRVSSLITSDTVPAQLALGAGFGRG